MLSISGIMLILTHAQCFENHPFFHFVFVVCCFKQEDKSGPCYSILAGSLSLD